MILIGVFSFYFYLGNFVIYRGGIGIRVGFKGEFSSRGRGGYGNRRLRISRYFERCVYKRYKIISDNLNG